VLDSVPDDIEVDAVVSVPVSVAHTTDVGPGLVGRQLGGLVLQTKRGLAKAFQATLYRITPEGVTRKRLPIHAGQVTFNTFDVLENVGQRDGWIALRRHVGAPG
jgi:hypothetical protein